MNTKQIFILIAVIVAVIGSLVYLNETKDNQKKSVQRFEVIADMSEGTTSQTPEIDFEKKLRDRSPVEVNFIGVDGKGSDHFNSTFSTETICDSISSKEDRRRWWRLEGQKQWETAVEAFEVWKDSHKPFRTYAIGVDITEGWDKKFSLSNFLSAEDIDWIKQNDFEITIYSMGVNEVPGKRVFKKGTVAEIESSVKRFLSQAPEEMPETKLCQQLSYIFNNSYYKAVVKSDLLHHEEVFSAYSYKAGDTVQLIDFFTERGSISPQSVEFIVESSIIGRARNRQAWYYFFQSTTELLYPETEFSFR